MSRRLQLLALLALALLGAVRAEEIRVVHPAERQKLPAVSEVYVIGSVAPGRTETLYVNGETTAVHRTGAFIRMVPVQPGANTLTLTRGATRLVRTFTVAAQEAAPAARAFSPILSDDDPRIGTPGTWKTTGQLLANRVRSAVDASDAVFFLPRGFAFRGAEVKGTSWIVLWLENQRGYLPRKLVARVEEDGPLPSKGLLAPDPCDGFSDHPPYGKPPSEVRICVDAGHGGTDVGALSPHGWYEKDVNLMQARAVRDALERAGFQVIMTRDGDSFPALLDRPALAYEEHVDAFVSIHHNSTNHNRDPRLARHTATYASNSNGLALARCIHKHVAQVMAPVPDAGAQLKSLAVCRNPAVPSCLVEVDFINLPEGEEESWSPQRQRKIADAVVCGVLDWMAPPPAPVEAAAGGTASEPLPGDAAP